MSFARIVTALLDLSFGKDFEQRSLAHLRQANNATFHE
jgi:hypothetical protein